MLWHEVEKPTHQLGWQRRTNVAYSTRVPVWWGHQRVKSQKLNDGLFQAFGLVPSFDAVKKKKKTFKFGRRLSAFWILILKFLLSNVDKLPKKCNIKFYLTQYWLTGTFHRTPIGFGFWHPSFWSPIFWSASWESSFISSMMPCKWRVVFQPPPHPLGWIALPTIYNRYQSLTFVDY